MEWIITQLLNYETHQARYAVRISTSDKLSAIALVNTDRLMIGDILTPTREGYIINHDKCRQLAIVSVHPFSCEFWHDLQELALSEVR